MKVPVNLDKYSALKRLAEEDKDQFLQILKGVFTTMDVMVREGYHEVAEEQFGIPIHELTDQLLQAMFDHRGMLKLMPNQENAAFISESYQHALNPLAAAFDATDLKDRSYKPVSFEEKFGIDKKKFTVKDWLQSLMFYSYYGSMGDLASYLFTEDHTLFDNEKHENIDKLIDIRPALAYQRAIGILPGKLIPGTGFFTCGDATDTLVCPACQTRRPLLPLDTSTTVCTECKAGYAI